MKITECVPLPGQGLVARFGDLIAVSDGLGTGPDPLLGAVERVTAAAGDGGALVRTAARAVLESDGQRSFACAGTTSTDELVVLVSGDATATLIVDGGQAVTLFRQQLADSGQPDLHRCCYHRHRRPRRVHG